MATITKTFYDINTEFTKATWTLNLVGTDYNVTQTSQTLTVSPPTATAKYVCSGRGYVGSSTSGNINTTKGDGTALFVGQFDKLRGTYSSRYKVASNTLFTILSTSNERASSVTASDVFNSSNPTIKSRSIYVSNVYADVEDWNASFSEGNWFYGNLSFSPNIIGYIYYKCPPVLAACSISKDTSSGYYAGITKATINVPITYSESGTTGTAKYGGYIKKIEANIGTESSILTFDSTTKPTSAQTLTLIPTVVGDNIPVSVTVTDSRDQTATQSLGTINVAAYNKPSVNFDVYRTDSTGKKADEGKYAIIDAQVAYTSGPTTIKQKPTVLVNGTDKTSSVTWYSSWNADGGVSGSAISSWSSISSGSKIYGLINGNFSETDSYQIMMTVVDTFNGTSNPVTQTLSTAFYTIDFQAGGKEIAFGAPANDNLTNINGKDYSDEGLFKCNMGTAFNDMTTQEISDFVDDVEAQTTVTPDTSEAITQNDLLNILNEVLPSTETFEESTTTITATTGTLNSHVMCRMGRFRFLRISVSKSTATAVGSNLFVGKITDSKDIPAHYVNGVGYIGSACCPAQIAAGGATDAGTITVRVTGANVPSNGSPWISFVYVASE